MAQAKQTNQQKNDFSPFTVPNLLTSLRILLLPLLILSFFISNDFGRWLAAIVFVSASASDFFDGYLARRWQQSTHFGRVLDPIADKVLIITTLFLLAAFGRFSSWMIIASVLMIIREILVSGLREIAFSYGLRLPVTLIAKWKTTLQMAALGLIFLGDIPLLVYPFRLLGVCVFFVATVLTIVSGLSYSHKLWRKITVLSTDMSAESKAKQKA